MLGEDAISDCGTRSGAPRVCLPDRGWCTVRTVRRECSVLLQPVVRGVFDGMPGASDYVTMASTLTLPPSWGVGTSSHSSSHHAHCYIPEIPAINDPSPIHALHEPKVCLGCLAKQRSAERQSRDDCFRCTSSSIPFMPRLRHPVILPGWHRVDHLASKVLVCYDHTMVFPQSPSAPAICPSTHA